MNTFLATMPSNSAVPHGGPSLGGISVGLLDGTLEAVKDKFLNLLPLMEAVLHRAFHCVRCHVTRCDAIAEGVALCWKWFVQLAHRGKDAARFIISLATFAAKAVRTGRTVCGQQPARDAMSLTAKIRHGVVVSPLPTNPATREPLADKMGGRHRLDAVDQYLADNTRTPVPDQVAFRIDWPAFVRTLPRRDRAMVVFLAIGHSNQDAAVKFQITPGRVSQLRKRWQRQWQAFRSNGA